MNVHQLSTKSCTHQHYLRRDFLFICAQPSELEWASAERRKNAAFQTLWKSGNSKSHRESPKPWLLLRDAVALTINEDKDDILQNVGQQGSLASSRSPKNSLHVQDRNHALTSLVGLGIARRSAPELLLTILLLLNVAYVEGDIWECNIESVSEKILECEARACDEYREKNMEPHEAEGGPHSKVEEDEAIIPPSGRNFAKKANLDDPMVRETARDKLKSKMQWNKKQRKSFIGKKKMKSSIVRMKAPGKAIGESSCTFL